MSKNLQTHIKYKYDSETNWNSAGWTSRVGEIYVYAPDSDHTETRLKIGDGIHTVIELPWAYIGDYTPPLVPVAAIPSQSGTLTYNGGSQSPSWSNYNSGQLTLSGTTAGTNAGNYTATFTPASGYCWPDGTTTAKNVVWSIGKATPTLSLNKSSVALSNSTTSATVTVTTNSTGSLTVSSNNSTYISASISNKTITVRSVNSKSGTAKITVSLAATTNYNARSTSFSVTATFTTVSSVLNNNSWETISKVAKEGTADQYWNVGDTKQVTINHNITSSYGWTDNMSGTYCVFIIGFDRKSSGQIDFQCFKTTSGTPICLIDDDYNSNSSSSYQDNNGFVLTSLYNESWNPYGGEVIYADYCFLVSRALDYSAISSITANKLIDALPADLQNVMVYVDTGDLLIHNKVAEFSEAQGPWLNQGDYNEMDMNSFKLTLPHVYDIVSNGPFGVEFEDPLYGEMYSGAMNESPWNFISAPSSPYPYYASGNSSVKYSYRSTGSAVYYWTLDYFEYQQSAPDYSDLGNFSTRCGFVVTPTGGVQVADPDMSYGVSPIFRLGNA